MSILVKKTQQYLQQLIHKQHYLEVRLNALFSKYLLFKPTISTRENDEPVSIIRNEFPFICKLCSEKFSDGAEFTEHLINNHPEILEQPLQELELDLPK